MNTLWDQHPDADLSSADMPEEAYRSLSVAAVASVVAGTLSIFTLLGPLFLFIPVLGVALGWHAWRQIRRSGGVLTGHHLAQAGILLSAVVGPIAWMVGDAIRAREVPPGYTVVTYATLAADPIHPDEVPPAAYELQGKRIYVKGYMYPGKQQTRIKQFVMSRDTGSCTFCTPNPTPTDLIEVQLMGDLVMQYTDRLIGVGGRLVIESDPRKRAADGVAYRIEADYLY